MEDKKALRLEITKASEPRKIKVTNSWGVYDCYKLIRKHKWYDIGRPVKEEEFYSIVRGVNDLFANEIALGNDVVFPSRMGKLELRKIKTGVGIVNGKLRITYPVDWEETLKLWMENEEARKNKTLIRNENEYIYRVKYCKYDATYENKGLYQFALNTFVKKALSKNIKDNKTDTPYIMKINNIG